MPGLPGHLQTFGERTNTRMEPLCMLKACIMSRIRVFAAMRQRVSAEQRVVFIIRCLQQRARRLQMPSLPGHLHKTSNT